MYSAPSGPGVLYWTHSPRAVITAWPAYRLGLIRKNDVLDIFVGTGTDRYVRLAIATALWALVTALLVQLFVDGGRALAARRRNKAAT